MTIYRPGQRIRAEWPDGSAVEGICEWRPANDLVIPVGDIVVGLGALLAKDCVVTVLPPARPDEPQGLGAVVEDQFGGFWVRADNGGHLCWREVLPGTYSENDATRRHWEQIVVVRVLSEGWQP